MSELANTLTEQTGISSDLVHQGLGALLNFLKKEVGDETFSKLTATIPGADGFLEKFSSSPAAESGGLLQVVTGLAGKLLGSKAADGASLLAALLQAGFHSRANRGVHSQGHRVDQGLSSPRFARENPGHGSRPCEDGDRRSEQNGMIDDQPIKPNAVCRSDDPDRFLLRTRRHVFPCDARDHPAKQSG